VLQKQPEQEALAGFVCKAMQGKSRPEALFDRQPTPSMILNSICLQLVPAD
jgi:hypothetical protein